MSRSTGLKVSTWVARIIALLFIALVTVGWLDESMARQDLPAPSSQDWFWSWAIFTHFIPLLLIVAGYIVGWKKPLFGAIAFGIFAVLQAISVGTEFIYIPLVVLPPLSVAALFMIPYFMSKRSA